MKNRLLPLLFLATFALHAAAEEDPAHAELRTAREGLLAAMNSGEIEKQLLFLHPNVVVTWHNAEVSRGRDGTRAYLSRMLSGPTKVVEKFGVEATVDTLSALYGKETAIAVGSAQEHFTLTTGRSFDLSARWSATLVKENGQWLIASLHASDNIFDNPLLNQMKSAVKWIGGGTLVMGLFLGYILGRRRFSA